MGDLARQRRDDRAIAFFGTWAIVGLFVDGWAHQANKPETFFTPWHLVLYSGVVCAVAWFAWDGRQQRGPVMPIDRLTGLGLATFVAGAIGDGIWHEVVGVEVDLEALLSPTHLLLMTGGLLMLSAPVRSALRDGRLAGWATVVALTLCASLATFFTMYAGAAFPIARGDAGELGEVRGVVSVLARNLLVMAPLLLARRRLALPLGACTALLAANALLMSALEGFDFLPLVVPFALAGIVGDLHPARSHAAFAIVVPAVLWSAYFVAHELAYGVDWAIELWSGAIFLAAASSYGLHALLQASTGAPSPAPADDGRHGSVSHATG